jgi:hypothetical protein
MTSQEKEKFIKAIRKRAIKLRKKEIQNDKSTISK